MKTLYLIGGTMGVGKTSVGERLRICLPNAVLLDGDWCWYANPFVETEETANIAMDNICHLLGNFLRCSVYQNIIFTWSMHEQRTIDGILSALDTTHCRVKCISLMADEETVRARIRRDIKRGIYNAASLEKSLSWLSLYQTLDTVKIDTTGKTVAEVAEEIKHL